MFQVGQVCVDRQQRVSVVGEEVVDVLGELHVLAGVGGRIERPPHGITDHVIQFVGSHHVQAVSLHGLAVQNLCVPDEAQHEGQLVAALRGSRGTASRLLRRP